MDEKLPVNGIVIVPNRDIVHVNSAGISLWTMEPWTASLDYDRELMTKIQNLMEKSKHESSIILANGHNCLCDRVVMLAELLGYKSTVFKSRHTESSWKIMNKKSRPSKKGVSGRTCLDFL